MTVRTWALACAALIACGAASAQTMTPTPTPGVCVRYVCTITPTPTPPGPPARFYTLPACRAIDTRLADGPLGGPALVAGTGRVFMLTGVCGIPATATAISARLVAVAPTDSGYLDVATSANGAWNHYSIPHSTGQVRGVTAVLNQTAPLTGLNVGCYQASGTVHFVLDVTGYFQ